MALVLIFTLHSDCTFLSRRRRPRDFAAVQISGLIAACVQSSFRAARSCPTSLNRSAPATGAASTSSHRHRIAEPVRHRAADKGAAGFVEAEIFVADGARRDKAVGAGLVELDEQAGARDAGNMPVECRADAVGQKMRDQPVRRSRARPSWRGVRWRRWWRRFRRAIAHRCRPAARRRRALPRGSGRDARRGRHSGGSAR